MREILQKLVFFFLIFFFCFPVLVLGGNKVKTVVIFFALNPNLPAYHNFLDGLNKTLLPDRETPCTILTEYLDITRTVNHDYTSHIVDIYNAKTKENPVDLYITGGEYTFSLLKQYGLNFNKDVPIIRIENDPPNDGSLLYASDKNVLDIHQRYKVRETLQQAFDLFPERNEVFVITGNSTSDRYYADLTMEASKNFSDGHHFTFFSGTGIDSLISIVRKVSKKCIVFIPIYLSGKDNTPFTTPEVISLIANNCNAPVFPLFDSFTESDGGIGGLVFSFKKLGEETGKCAMKILNGTPVSGIIPSEDAFSVPMFDWQQLKKWNLLDSKAIPANSIFLNQEFNFVHEYRWYILGLFLILVSQSLLIIFLVLINRKQKKIAQHRRETEKLYHLLIREDRLALMVELSASISHELNQPLTGILYTAEAGKKYLDSGLLDHERAKKLFDNIIEDDTRASDIISSIRSLMSKEIREKEKVDMVSLIRETLTLFTPEATRQNIRTQAELGNKAVPVYGDKVQLQQVLLNLLTNAASAMEHTPPALKLIIISLLLKEGYVFVSVRDSGKGISEEVRVNLFKSFITSKKTGFGIGLALCRSIIQSHNGEIWAGNASGGAEFSFKLQILSDGK
jgi:signal transduction histidine kinase